MYFSLFVHESKTILQTGRHFSKETQGGLSLRGWVPVKGNTQLLVLQNHFGSIKRNPFTGRSVTSALQNWLTCCVYFTDEFCPTISTLQYPVTDRHTQHLLFISPPRLQKPVSGCGRGGGEQSRRKEKTLCKRAENRFTFPAALLPP